MSSTNESTIFQLYLKQLEDLEQSVENAIHLIGEKLLKAHSRPTLEIILGDGELLVGEFISLINGYPEVEMIIIRSGSILLKLELVATPEPLEDFITFSIKDKISILETLEIQLQSSPDEP